MKNKIIVSLTCLFILCTSFIFPVSALEEYDPFASIIDDTQYYGSFLGVEYPIHPNLEKLGYYAYDVNGFSVDSFVSINGSLTWFNQSYSVNANQNYKYAVQAWFPSPIGRGKTVDLVFKFTTNMNVDNLLSLGFTAFDSYGNTLSTGSHNIKKISSASFAIECSLTTTSTTRYVELLFNGSCPSSTVSLVCTGAGVYEVEQGAADLSGIESILSNIGLNINEIGVNVISIRDYCISLIEAINLNFGILHEKIDGLKSSMISKLDEVKTSINTIGSNIVASVNSFSSSVTGHFNSLNTWIQNQTASITSKLNELLVYFKGNEQSNSSVENNNQSSNNANDTFSDYNDIESGYMDSMSSNLGSIDTNNNLFGMGDFVKTGSFVSTQLENIYNSNVIIQNMVMYGLILGLSLTVIGISTKRG